ncbi:hypothetical protein GT039_38965, partial [Streptomyces sp. SID2955]|nr:hypothetical protein [Streptomyces sp. SID2955]
PPRSEVLVPFAWTGVTLHSTGAPALRVKITRGGGDTITLHLADATGAPVADIEALTSRPVQADDVLYTVRWSPVPRPATTAPVRTAVLDGAADGLDALLTGPAPDAVLHRVPGPASADAA